MGYKSKAKRITLDFDGDKEFEGLEVTTKGLSIGDYLDVAALTNEASTDVTPLLAAFASSLISWNLEDEDDQPVPATLEGVKSQDIEFIMTIVSAWMKAAAGVKDSVGKDSPSGETSLEASMLTAAL